MRSLANFRAARIFALSCALPVCLAWAHGATAQTLKAIKERGVVACGVSQGVTGFSMQSERGEWTGLDVDFCRALAAAIFNDATKTKFVPLPADDRFRPLQSKEI